MDNKLLFSDLVQALADKGFSRKEADVFARSFFSQVEKCLFSGETVKVKGLGTFKLQKVEARKSVNVNTGEPIEIEGHYKLSFLPDTELKEAANRPYADLDNIEMDKPSGSPLFTVYDSESSKKEGVPFIATLLKVLGTCLLLACIVYMFLHFGMRKGTQVETPEITIVKDTIAVESEPQLQPIEEDTIKMACQVADDDPMAWETLTTVKTNRGDRLTLFALQYYGDKVFWVYLFLANQDVLKNPNSLPAGKAIRIPKAPVSVVNADDSASLAKAHELELQLKQLYD